MRAHYAQCGAAHLVGRLLRLHHSATTQVRIVDLQNAFRLSESNASGAARVSN